LRFAHPWALLLAPLAWAVAAAAVRYGRSAALAYPAGERTRARRRRCASACPEISPSS